MDFRGFGVRSPPSSFQFFTNKEHFKADHYLHRYSSPRKSDGIREQNDSGKSHQGRTRENVSVSEAVKQYWYSTIFYNEHRGILR